MKRVPVMRRRVPINRTVKPSTVKLLAKLAESNNTSEGRIIDRAVETLAVTETFGREHLKGKG